MKAPGLGWRGQRARLEAGGGAPDVGLGTAAEPGRGTEEESFATWLRGQSSWRRILDDWVLPVLRSDGVRGVLGGRDTIWLDSLDEALASRTFRFAFPAVPFVEHETRALSHAQFLKRVKYEPL